MADCLTDLLQFKRFPELEPFFNKSPFLDIKIADDRISKMMGMDFVRNTTTRFWRILKIKELLNGRESDVSYAEFLLEMYLNSIQSCVDACAAMLNHFLELELKGPSVALQKKDFVDAIKAKLSANSINIPACLDSNYIWIDEKTYPYRNIVHHLGAMSAGVSWDSRSSKVISTLFPRPEEFDFKQIKKEMDGYASSHTSLLVAQNKLKIPNIITGENGDMHKYYPISDFFDEWIKKIYEVIICSVGIIVSYQNKE